MINTPKCAPWIKQLLTSVIFGLILILCFSPASAIMPVPDIGVNYQTMKVENTTYLKAAGMKDIRKGDGVDVQVSDDGTVTVTNQRTSEYTKFRTDE